MGQARAGRTSAGVPERRGRYEILVPIAAGGMGMVYLARCRGAGGFEREVALKLLHPHAGHHDRLADELIEEAKLTALIRHPNVVQVYDVEEDELGIFMAMEYVEGCSLADLLRALGTAGGHLSREVALRILLDALAGLHAAHEIVGRDGRPLDLIHRDFSPQNILIGMDGATRLGDFGIAKAAGREGRTMTGAIKGKLGYLAPEQIRGSTLDRRCDVWAAGVIAWEVLSGRRLYAGSDDAAVMYRILDEPAAPLRSVNPEIPPALEEAVARALVKVPSGRCPSAAAFARTLEAAGIEVAPADEVAAYVRRVVGDQLAERRAQIAETLQARRLMPPGRDTSSTSRDAPAVTAPTRETTSRWLRSSAVGTIGLVAVLAAVLGGAVATAILPGSRGEAAGAAPLGAPGDQAPASAAVTVSPPPPGDTPVPGSSGAAISPEPSAQKPSSTAPNAASTQGPSSAVPAPAGSGKARPPKSSLPLADSPYLRKP